ncbi:copper-binding protein [Asticcacaulis excentricus]|uniref:Copper binding periplasmic protein CusF n=1 Tax=Asticcacaulis excentricus (strain ATCC 15261 / DSM 4724 / KCTC 12464 / NCIMB 9791 / VKM B-1370 / CB 48) TaxID=573065 RepID=E8RW29_ASTEC|nr:copper-binding protein [Asticcacaulis excentricus]ADU15451.1 Copper binding periplasmic protein CusF [Asticcacaulis excentricus CB 48]
MNTKLSIAALAILALAILSTAPLASAQDGMKGMDGMYDMAGMNVKSMPRTGSGTGVIKTIDVKSGKITIAHGPIASLKWPAMTMTFSVNPASLLNGLKVGQKVAFDVSIKGSDSTITALQPAQ